MEPPFPPFDPEEHKSQQVRLRDVPLRTLFPNILTLLAICSGLTAIRFAIEERLELALAAILLAAILDGIDGRVARFLKSSTRFGAQMDSLADFVNFGVAPVMVLYFTMLHELKPFGWVAALVYAMCACLRLARFNVQIDAPNRPSFHNDFFVGVPAPAGAMIVLLPVYALLLGLEESLLIDFLTAIYVVFVGLLMVSNLPTYSGKSFGKRIPRQVAMPLILLSVVIIALLLSYPWQMLTAAALAYIVALPVGRAYYFRLQAAHENEMAEAAAKSANEPSDDANQRRTTRKSPTKKAAK